MEDRGKIGKATAEAVVRDVRKPQGKGAFEREPGRLIAGRPRRTVFKLEGNMRTIRPTHPIYG